MTISQTKFSVKSPQYLSKYHSNNFFFPLKHNTGGNISNPSPLGR